MRTRNFIRKAIQVIIFWSIHGSVFAQVSADYTFLFKTWLFLEKENSTSRYDTLFRVKDPHLFSLFQKEVELNFDTLKAYGFSSDYIFLSVISHKDNKPVNDKAIIYKNSKLMGALGIPINNCNGYILCINKDKGTSYRLQGFQGNDFFPLLYEVQGERIQNFKGNLSVSSFLKNYRVEGIDFQLFV